MGERGNDMPAEVIWGVMLPFAGTAAGAVFVLFMERNRYHGLLETLMGVAAGVMAAASVWSLILPALEQSSGLGVWSFIPAVTGFWLGVLCLLLLDVFLSRLCRPGGLSEGCPETAKKVILLALAVILHNIPEGMAVGVAYAGWMAKETGITLMGAWTLALGIAIQNIPEGAIISLPLRGAGQSRPRALCWGILSGAVEPAAALLTILASRLVVRLLPYCLGFAAGAMMFVVVAELVPEASSHGARGRGVLSFSLGFTLMLALDVALG